VRDHDTYLFSGYARLPQNVSHQALYKRVGVVVEVDRHGLVVGCSSTLVTELARDFLDRLLRGCSALDDRDLMEELVRRHYRAHSQGALIFALRKVFEAVDQSVLVLGEQAAEAVAEEEGATSADE
jgi:hypothetical protein